MWLQTAVVVVLSVTAAHAAKNYGTALKNSILFYDAQRSGKLPHNNPISWRGDSGLHDCVVGGWYDAGDNVKFGFPMAASTTLLAWGFITFHDGYTQAGQVGQMYDSLKWPLDYFLKAWNPGQKKLVVQVGDGNKDHSHWSRPEDMSNDRPCYSVDTHHAGSDVAAETAAAMAAGSLAFKAHDGSYAGKLLHAAESLYDFAKSHRGIYSKSIPQAAAFYSSSGDKDELCLAAMWLYKATHQSKYLNDAKSFHENAWGWALSWDDKKVACQLMLYEATKSGQYRTEVEGFMKGWLPGGSVTYTPCGLAWRDQWGSNRYVANSAFLALLAAEAGIQASTYRKWAVEQINYLLGDNPHNGQQCYSYEVGYGSHYPQQPHHRAASCGALHTSCSFEHLHTSSPNPHTLVGALVGGPDAHDNYNDKRDDYVKNEVACDYNSGFQGALAGIVHLQKNHHMPSTHNKCPCH